MSESVDSRLAGKTPGIALPLFTDATTRNPNSWVADLDLTGISTSIPHSTAISPLHVIGAAHFGLSGTFLGSAGVVTRTVVSSVVIPGTDILIGTLNSPLPSEISPVKLVPNSFLSKHKYYSAAAPVLLVDGQNKALVFDLSNADFRSYVYWSRPSTSRILWHENLIGGDSGGPALVILGNTFGVISSAHYPNSGPSFPVFASEIASIVAAGGQSVQYLDLEEFDH